MMKIVLILLFCLLPLFGIGQYFQFSQYNVTSQRVNPASVASSDFMSADLIYRDQNTAGDVRLKSSMISAAYPLLSRKNGMRWSGIGISLMDDRSGGLFTVQEASLSYALNVFLNRYQSLSLGFKGLYQQRRFNLSGLFTESQYIHDRGFDESLFNGENFGLLRSDFTTFSTGLFWQQNSRKGTRIAYWGVSIFDLNKPDDSFSGTANQLHSTWVATAGFRIYEQQNISIMPELLLTHSTSKNVLNIGAVTSYEIKGNSRQASGKIDLITKYVPGRSGIFGIQFHREKFSVGFSYDFPVFNKNPGNTGALEVGLQIRRLVDPPLRKRVARNQKPVNRNKSSVAKTVTPGKTKKIDSRSVVKEDSVTDKKATEPDMGTTLLMKRDSVIAQAKAGKVSQEPFVIEKTILRFSFEFNSTSLDDHSTKYLDGLSRALAENSHMKISLTGHTDNVGSPPFNMRLSLVRANALREYLVKKGVAPSRIVTEGKGLTAPLNDNRTEGDRALNRRVELTIFYEE
jgi:type IX secretion system PorP/SprF family membrane protein